MDSSTPCLRIVSPCPFRPKLTFCVQVKKEGENDECATFELDDEDHTLGNALRYTICKNPSVKFCGYSMPHPNERRVLIQIQVYPGKGSALKALTEGLQSLKQICEVVKTRFQTACQEQ